MNKYIEVVRSETEIVVKRYSVGLMPEIAVSFLENAIDIDIINKPLFRRRTQSKTELETGNI